jgi:hypothetical protein
VTWGGERREEKRRREERREKRREDFMRAVVALIFGESNPVRLLAEVKVTLRLEVYRQSIRLGAKPLEVHDHRFFYNNPCGHSRHVNSRRQPARYCS